MRFLEHLHSLCKGGDLSVEPAREAMEAVLAGEATTAQIAAFLAAVAVRGETVEMLEGFALAMCGAGQAVPVGERSDLLDTCGTGGDGHSTFNISTTVAFVVAGAGVRVAKHGNRAVSSRCGSGDVLEALGVRIDLTAGQMGACLDEVGMAFLYAPVLHPAMRHAAAARKELGMRTAFNLLGPLTNPAGAEFQLVGASSAAAARLMAETLARLGTKRSLVVHGADGLDEISVSGPTAAWNVENGRVMALSLEPETFGLAPSPLAALQVGDREESAAATLAVLGGELGARRSIVLANASAALVVAGRASHYGAGMALAAEAVDSGAALGKLRDLAFVSQRLGREESSGGA